MGSREVLHRRGSVSSSLGSRLRALWGISKQPTSCHWQALEFTVQPRLGAHLSEGALGPGHQLEPSPTFWQQWGDPVLTIQLLSACVSCLALQLS